jgi:hypothetical protein
MAQITLYIDESTQLRLRDAAAKRKLSQSQFVAELIRRATATDWPDEVLGLAGSVPDFPHTDALRAGVADDATRPPW